MKEIQPGRLLLEKSIRRYKRPGFEKARFSGGLCLLMEW
jgi:hypothetical protein